MSARFLLSGLEGGETDSAEAQHRFIRHDADAANTRRRDCIVSKP
jgi:hypothetical protein